MERIINIDKKHALNGSFTVEMSLLMPMILFLVMGCVLACFYYHDKNIIAGAAYETDCCRKVRKPEEKDGIQEAELKALFQERVGKKCILFPGAMAVCSVSKEEIRVSAVAKRRKMSLAVESRASVTEPERYIRDIRRIKK